VEVYGFLRKRGLRPSPYLVLAAMELAKEPAEQQDALVDRTRAWFDAMRDVHPYLSAQDDYLYAALLARHGVDPSDASGRYLDMERILSAESRRGNDLQTLTHVLMLAGDEAVSLSERAREVLSACHDRRLFLRFSGAMSLAGVLAMLDGEPDALVAELMEGEAYLRGKRGFSDFSVNRGARLLIVTQAMVKAHQMEALADAGILESHAIAMLEAQQTALMCASVMVITSNNAG